MYDKQSTQLNLLSEFLMRKKKDGQLFKDLLHLNSLGLKSVITSNSYRLQGSVESILKNFGIWTSSCRI
jgi:hypothetical protein